MSIQFLLDNFEQLFDSEEKIKNFDKIILQLAVSGRLNTQHPEDEPATTLLNRITAEKQALIKAGTLKPQKPLPPVTEAEQPFTLPDNWLWVRLGEVSFINPKNTCDDSVEFSFIPMNLVSKKFNEHPSFEKRLWKDIKKGFTHFANNDVVLAKITPCFENGKSGIMKDLLNGFGAGTTELYVFRGVAGLVLPELVYIHFKTSLFLKNGETNMTGSAGQKRVPRSFVENYSLPLPPLAEQQRIVAKVEELLSKSAEIKEYFSEKNKMRVKLNQSLLHHLQESKNHEEFKKNFDLITSHFNGLYDNQENMKALRQTILQLAVSGRLNTQHPEDEPATTLLNRITAEKQALIKAGKLKPQKPLPPVAEAEQPFTLPDSWLWVRLQDVGKLSRGKSKHRPRNAPELFDGEYPFIQTGDIAKSTLYVQHHSQTYNEAGLAQSKLFPKNTLCITIAANIGESAILKYPACFPDSIVGFIPYNQLSEVLFAYYFINIMKTDLEKYAPATAQKNINLNILDKLAFPLPPLAEQQRIVAKVEELMALCDALEAQLAQQQAHATALLNSLVHELVGVGSL
ncbi:MAG: restriction endonuclease subunit S [Vampirovibrio sp.]|nr:restriction endonuclease subunit S [Vampirovibrio sp.]